jgi:transcription initiation factor TFIIB
MPTDNDSHEHHSRIEAQTDTCPECNGGLLPDRKHAHTYCGECGLVVDDTHLWRDGDGGYGGTRDDSTGSGNGALATKKDESKPPNRRIENSESRTTFHSYESDNHAKFRQLWRHQHGWYDDNTEQRKHRDFRLKTVEAICNTLRLHDRIASRAKQLADQVDPRGFNSIGGPYAIALGAIAVAQNETIEDPDEYENRVQVRKYDHHDGDAPLFKSLADTHNVAWQTAMRKVKEQSGR